MVLSRDRNPFLKLGQPLKVEHLLSAMGKKRLFIVISGLPYKILGL